jgi:hypothetical protein
MILLVAALVVLVLVGALFAASYLASRPAQTPSPTLNITDVTMNFSGAANCWTSFHPSGVWGDDRWSSDIQFTYQQGLFEPASCTLTNVRAQTSGFGIVSVNTPLVVVSGATETLHIVVQGPSTDYTGPLSLIGTVTSP